MVTVTRIYDGIALNPEAKKAANDAASRTAVQMANRKQF